MRVIPVIDLMHGQVVRGVGGRRDEYRPIESTLARDARPATVGRALAEAGFRSIYVADLDAIGGASPAWSIYDDLLDGGLALVVDAGLTGVDDAVRLAAYTSHGCGLEGIVAGLESSPGPDVLAAMCRAVGPERLVFSLDLKSGRPLTSAPAWQTLDPLAIATLALRVGIRRMIVLDLAAVGMGTGARTERLCRELRCLDPALEIIAGGGVRGTADLQVLSAAGCDGVLVASALHDGRLSAAECAAARW